MASPPPSNAEPQCWLHSAGETLRRKSKAPAEGSGGSLETRKWIGSLVGSLPRAR